MVVGYFGAGSHIWGGSQGCLENSQYKLWEPQIDVQYMLGHQVRKELGSIKKQFGMPFA